MPRVKTNGYTHITFMRDGRQDNGEKRVGVIPGVEVGDQFKYKTQLYFIKNFFFYIMRYKNTKSSVLYLYFKLCFVFKFITNLNFKDYMNPLSSLTCFSSLINIVYVYRIVLTCGPV